MDLDCCINILSTLSTIFETRMEETFKSVPVMLTGYALNLYANNRSHCDNFDEAMTMFRSRYNNDDLRARILSSKVEIYDIIGGNDKDPSESEVNVFRKFVPKLISLKTQPENKYHMDQFLIYSLLTPFNIPSIQPSLRDRFPRTSPKSINWISNRLSDKKISACPNSACMISG